MLLLDCMNGCFLVLGEGGDGDDDVNCGDGDCDDETPALLSSLLSRC